MPIPRCSRPLSRSCLSALAPLAGLLATLAPSLVLAHDNHMKLGLIGAAEAHHAMGGGMVQSFGDGLLSGLAHPVIGLDHLAALIAIGIIAAALGAGLAMPLAFVAASFAGVGLHLALVDLPHAEILVAGSVVLFGALLLARVSLGRGAFVALGALAGLFHGYAFGESIVGAEPTPLFAYLLGLALIQAIVTTGTCLTVERLAAARPDMAAGIRMAGIAVVAVGAMALLTAVA